ncbi:hypothetical protein EDC56_0798 [Sinobacterium caligoides]|uniref:Nitrogen fixation protein FixH n=1 Tax=Sinobacterium caligoides TaxID=933926 RepID=A0A3N2DZL2_9GAMM|nr:FixH family protein [Sinobacterium caligoides]ROS05268.1 hypothetical protein EDC56_0798 [Sinobacterium caligoides]
MATLRKHEDDQPWFKQFWPWFIIALPATAVVASLHLVYVAMEQKPDLVRTNYYKDGLAINEELSAERLADQLDINADMRFTDEMITIDLKGRIHTKPVNIVIAFQHPTDATKDTTIIATRGADNIYRSTEGIPAQRWYIGLEGMDEASMKMWNIKGEVDLSQQEHITLTDRSL